MLGALNGLGSRITEISAVRLLAPLLNNRNSDCSYSPGGGGGHSLVSSVPMRDQRIVEHTLNSVIDI